MKDYQLEKVQRQVARIFGVKISPSSNLEMDNRGFKVFEEFVDSLKVEFRGNFHVDKTMIKCEGGLWD